MFDFNTLRKKYPEFIYHSFNISKEKDLLKITYHFEIVGLTSFAPQWTFSAKDINDIDDSVINNMVFSLGMVELISYWKSTCSPIVTIKAGGLDSDMISWWKSLYFDGLGEFFYVNGIKTDVMNFMTIVSEGEFLNRNENYFDLKGSLVPIGGGKDSSVTLKILKKAGEDITPFVINGREATRLTCEVFGICDSTIIVKRILDKTLIDLNSKGFLNGHTPFSAIVAFSSILAAVLNRKKYVVLSNESSANESTVLGEKVNHQFSKSEDFENNFINYEKKYINSGVSYFSLLRPLSEMQIAMLFSKYKEFHPVFKSCNVGSKKDIWCCNCPKCLFVYTILSPFLSEEELVSIFGENLLNREDLIVVFDELSGILPNKPFECVGSRDEVIVSAKSTIDKIKSEGKPLPIILEHFYNTRVESSNNLDYYRQFYDNKNHLPIAFENVLIEELKEQTGYVSKN